MLNVLTDGPFRYIHSAATGELVMTLMQLAGGRFVDESDEILGRPCAGRTLREWKAIARRRMGDQLITDTDGRN